MASVAEAVPGADDQCNDWELHEALSAKAAPPDDDMIRRAAESLQLGEKVF
jgi:hypothetical protein